MLELISGNLCGLLAMGTDALSASRKTARGILLVQCLSQIIYGTGSILLKGYSAAVQNGISILRNLQAAYKIKSRTIEWLLIALGVALGIYFNNLGLLGWLPVVGNLEYSLAVFRFKDDERSLKIAFAVNIVMFAVFNAAIKNFVGATANIVVLVMTILFLIRDRKEA